MPKVNTSAMLKKAQRGGYAVGHFNTSNLEITQAIREAAQELRAPVIVGCSKSAVEYAGLPLLVDMINKCLTRPGIKVFPTPYAIHLDHGPDVALAKRCIDAGFSSVMIDSSALPFAKNVAVTKQVVAYAHKRGVSVEAEIGILKGIEDYVKQESEFLTPPKQAMEFVRLTKVNSLAIAIGTSHGAFKFSGEAHLDLKRLQEIREQVDIPLVLHGASSVYPDLIQGIDRFGGAIKEAHGVPDSIIKKCIKRGICKVNTDTDLRLAFDLGIREFLIENPGVFDYRKILQAAKEQVKDVVKKKIYVFGSENKA